MDKQTNPLRQNLLKVLILLGSLAMLVALLWNLFGFAPSGKDRLMLFEIGLLSALAGSAVYFKARFTKQYQNAAILVLNTLLMLIALDLIGGVVFKGSFFIRQFFLNDLEALSPYYEKQDWTDAYWAEYVASFTFDYQPYVIWRRQPDYQGKYIHLDGRGIRQTPGAVCPEEAETVFMFGGSTMWGMGAPDWGTIAAYMQEGLAAQSDRPVCVINFGESGYVSAQEMVALTLELKAGHIPDRVIFYDGVNEVYAAYDGHADRHQNYAEIARIFEGQSPAVLFYAGLKDSAYSFAFLDSTLESWRDKHIDIYSYKKQNIQADDLATDIWQRYQENIDFVHVLAEAYDFEVYFFWQPVLSVEKKPLLDYEQKIRDSIDPDMNELFIALYRLAESAAAESERGHFYYMGNVFQHETRGIWFDLAHITPEGNRLVAEAMLEIIKNR